MPTEQTFDTGKVKINYLDFGSSAAEPVVMVHGGAWCWQEYLSLIPSLSQTLRIYALDLRGNGRSGWIAGQYRLEDFTDDTAAFLRSLKAPAILVGHSIGGVIALMTAARCPEKVKALVIEDSPLTLENYRRVIDSSREMFGVWLELKRCARSGEDLALALAAKYKDYPGVTSQWILFFAGCLWQLDPSYFNALLDDFEGFTRGYDYKQTLSKIKCPILFIRGESRLGAVMTDEEIFWLKRNLTNVRVAEIAGVGHLLHLQDQGQTPVLNAMTGFLEGIPK
jgi:pimeloyl-ACP methyl ester carboxylesterase